MRTLLLLFAGVALTASAGFLSAGDAPSPPPAPLDLAALFAVDTLELDTAGIGTDLGALEPDGDAESNSDTRVAGSGVDVEAAAALHASFAP